MSHKCGVCLTKFNNPAQAKCGRSTCPSKVVAMPKPGVPPPNPGVALINAVVQMDQF